MKTMVVVLLLFSISLLLDSDVAASFPKCTFNSHAACEIPLNWLQRMHKQRGVCLHLYMSRLRGYVTAIRKKTMEYIIVMGTHHS